MITLTQAKIWLFAATLFVAVCLSTAAWPWPGTVVAVHDGDTIESYGRIVGGVIVLHNGKTVQEELIRAGLAWVDARYCKRGVRECRAWTELQQEAAEARRGLWRALDSRCKPVAPWIWRRKGIHND